ncbi:MULTISPECIES: toprim domain-containing protein [unclassified Sphingopyxis]|jgi:hypothetical protein|uniref:DUF7146 domain-containing protein n=1 Tax=unclassified Sphingopyxis TaxID=2614943 RepID=UPI000731BF9C|nr:MULTISPECIES: toprim domain-containing protein [unclassified Sphingopyxis]KTE24106.1 DNA primase [Sphingopyxis sp. H057]KTE50404.1 DNA primase [Sphingopyxis sp. H073]KTE52493.1 DNA primase [Sphingopyxis sp. H071]KTE62986.1 DNA primase [Sphingopyxis sp. H107]KTE64874.1 DNA primase [Sphingopyxis sp. H100]
MDQHSASDIAQRLGSRAEAVCRQYLSNGRREGRYWLVGDVRNTPGRSLYVRLVDMHNGPAGKWTDAATGEHGDLLDIIAVTQGCRTFAETLAEARRFLSLPSDTIADVTPRRCRPPGRRGSQAAVRRIIRATDPLVGSIAADYLRTRAIHHLEGIDALRSHRRLYYRHSKEESFGTAKNWPALIGIVTDLDGSSTGVHRTWIDPATRAKAPVADPRRSMGQLLGHAIRFGTPHDVMIVGEGIETLLSLHEVMPDMPMAAATSSAHLAAFLFPPLLHRLYIATDNDDAGRLATTNLAERARHLDIEVIPLVPKGGDFNDDLQDGGADALAAHICDQLCDVDRSLIRQAYL